MLKTKDKKPKVYYHGNFWTRFKWERIGKRIPVQQRFLWDLKSWLIPAVYFCSKGLVIDFCIQIPLEELQSFYKKWGNADYAALSKEEKQDIEKTNPMAYDFGAYLWLNGTKISYSHGCAVGWNPFSDNSDECVKTLLHFYRLDTSKAWLIQRKAFPWTKKKASKIDTLSVELEQALQEECGPSIFVTDEKQSFDFMFAPTGEKHTLKILKYSRQIIDNRLSVMPDNELPTHCVRMEYAIEPELPDGAFTVTDRQASDEPILKDESKGRKNKDGACAIAIIGGADHITEIFSSQGKEKVYVSYSSLYFTPPQNVEWQVIFYKRTIDNEVLRLV